MKYLHAYFNGGTHEFCVTDDGWMLYEIVSDKLTSESWEISAWGGFDSLKKTKETITEYLHFNNYDLQYRDMELPAVKFRVLRSKDWSK